MPVRTKAGLILKSDKSGFNFVLVRTKEDADIQHVCLCRAANKDSKCAVILHENDRLRRKKNQQQKQQQQHMTDQRPKRSLLNFKKKYFNR